MVLSSNVNLSIIPVLSLGLPVLMIILGGYVINKEYSSEEGKSNSKSKRFYQLSKSVLILGIIISAVFCIRVLNHICQTSDSGNNSKADGFKIDSYNVILNVGENNTVKVKEEIGINFYETGHHGIYKFIPSWLKYTSKDNVTQSKQAVVENLRAEGENYTVDTVGKNKKRIRIGSSYYTLPTGLHKYTIDYDYVMGYDTYKGFDEFIFHVYGDYWGTNINNATVEVHMPKAFNNDGTIHFFADKKRKKDITKNVDYYIEGNVLYAKVSPQYNLSKSLTVDIELPDGYFISGTNNYGNTSFFLCLICIVISGLTFILWMFMGKDLDKVPETVEFYPPGKLDPSQIGYIAKGDTGRKLSIALIVSLASKGYIEIVESDDKNRRTIMNNYALDINSALKREITITKVKDYKESFLNLHPNADLIMKNWFPEGKKTVTLVSDFDRFYKEADYLISEGYIKVEHDTINDYTKDTLDNIETEVNKTASDIKERLTPNEQLVYNALFEESNQTDLSKNYNFYKVFSKVSTNVRTEYDDAINDISAYKAMALSSIGFLIASFLLGLAYSKFYDMSPTLSFMYGVALIANITTLVLTVLMKRRSFYGEQLIARVNGFKNYLELAEKEQIEAAVEQNPNYFFDILPYAYVLGVSKKWIEKFESIPMAELGNNMGGFSFNDLELIDSLSSDVYTPPVSSSSYSGSGSSSCGGGCSSCGGGCSSCGGGGSW